MKLLSLSGLIPEYICDTIRFFDCQGNNRISHYCPYASDFISCLQDHPDIDGAVFPKTCDSTRAMQGYLESLGKFYYSFHIPVNNDESSISYLSQNLLEYKKALEGYFHIKIDDIADRVQKINQRNQNIKYLYDHLDNYGYTSYLEMIHDHLTEPLSSQVSLPAPSNQDGKRVFLMSSTITSLEIIQKIETCNMKIVADRLPESRRLISTPEVSLSGNIYENIARSMLSGLSSPTRNHFHQILLEDKEEMLLKKVQGVIFISQQYCEPYDFLYPLYHQMTEEMNLPSLHLVISGNGDISRHALEIETFSGML